MGRYGSLARRRRHPAPRRPLRLRHELLVAAGAGGRGALGPGAQLRPLGRGGWLVQARCSRLPGGMPPARDGAGPNRVHRRFAVRRGRRQRRWAANVARSPTRRSARIGRIGVRSGLAGRGRGVPVSGRLCRFPSPDASTREVRFMGLNRSPGARTRHRRAAQRHGTFRLGATLAAVVLVLAACSDGSGGSAAPGGTTGEGGDGGDAGGYPEDQITFIVPFSAGGPTDTVTRLVAEPMAAELGVEIVVQNVEGAGGTVAAEQVANEEPDGYTVLMHHIGMSTAPTLYPDLPYDPIEG